MQAHYESRVEWKGPKMTAAVKSGGRAGVRKGGEFLKSKAVPLAPLDWGPLRESATVKLINAEPVAYVVFDTEYAKIQHERTDFNHTEGQSHYLSQPLEENAKQIQGIIGEEMRVHLARA